MCPAIHISSRSWLRSSSTHEPSDPPLRIVLFILYSVKKKKRSVNPPFSFQPSPLFKRKNKKQEAAGSGRTLLPSKPRDHRGPPARPKFPADANGLLPSDTQHRQSTQAEKPASRAEPTGPDRSALPVPTTTTGKRWWRGGRRHHNATVNDPSAGSPTETLLRLLLPLNDQV